jgi:AcrR family transcriptional regulator
MISRTDAPRRPTLSRRRVLRAAVELADGAGLEALTMRSLARTLSVEAMSLYHHVANKEALLDGVVEVVVEEILAEVSAVGPPPEEDWRGAMRARILTARQVMLRHPWAPRVLESRTNMTPEIIGYFDGLLGIFRAGGFSYDLAHHALHALGSRALGFTRELFAPADAEVGEAEAIAMMEQLAGRFPHLAGMLAETGHEAEGTLGWCDDQAEFEFGLDLLLDGLDRRRESA